MLWKKKIKFFTLFGIPYIFLCAGLYQMAYWLPFDINGFSFLSTSDIILSFIQPFLYSSFFSLGMYLVNYQNLTHFLPYGEGNIQTMSTGKKIFWQCLEMIYLLYIVYLILHESEKLKAIALPIVLIPGIYFLLLNIIKNQGIEMNKLRKLLLFFTVLLPLLSFHNGSKNAYDIYDCKKFQYSTSIIPNDSLKFLGKASEYYIFVSIDNNDRYVYNAAGMSNLKLNKYTK